MKNKNQLFGQGTRVRIKTGVFSGREGVVVQALHDPKREEPWWLMVETRSFDRSKVFVPCDGSHVEPAHLL